ncbi:MAG: aminotransferase class V-fold PLP-dependent enzyme, partial [bacterium]|nr:aminotransferase class V-fold PLP-dependent enzyme [bacterium]
NEAADPQKVEQAIKNFHPKMVTMVHCETPSGILNPLKEIGELISKYSVPLFFVDAVSSAGGVEIKADDWNIDLCVIGSQKCLSAPPDISITAVSERSWKIIDFIDYKGYDALLPWESALENRWFPYTPSWHSVAAIYQTTQSLLSEGMRSVFVRHRKAAEYCRKRVKGMGLELFPIDEYTSSPTVSAVKVPLKINWQRLDTKLRSRGMVVGGSLGKLANNVFRIGHMGSQANMDLLEHGMDILEYVLLYN